MGKPSRKERAPPAAEAEKLPKTAAPEDAKDAVEKGTVRAELPAPPRVTRKQWLQSVMPEGNVLPWWVVLFLAVYVIVKIGLAIEHPCGILGMSGTVTRGQVSKAYRALSMCTHPDKLRSKSEDAMRRGELFFKRASGAREELLGAMRVPEATTLLAQSEGVELDPTATCSTQLDAMIYGMVLYLSTQLYDLGSEQIMAHISQTLLGVLTFEHGVQWSAAILLLMLTFGSFLYALVRQFFFVSGPVTAVLSAVAAAVVGPLPTLALFFALPLMRCADFYRSEVRPALGAAPPPPPAPAAATDASTGKAEAVGGEAAAGDTAAAGAAESDEEEEDGEEAAAEAAEAAEEPAALAKSAARSGALGGASPGGRLTARDVSDLPSRRGLRQRGSGPAGRAQQEAQREALLDGSASPHQRSDPRLASANPFVRALGSLARRPGPSGRADAAKLVQFDLLLSSTKPVIPLLCLLATGQVYNGLMFSLFTAQVLQRLPAVRSELMHCLVLLAGALHTLVHSDKAPPTEKDAGALLQISWSWSFRDVVGVANVILVGATFCAVAGAGNEPPLSASFAAGLALRMAAHELLPAGAWAPVARALRSQNFEFVGADEVAARAAGGVGGCAGGPFRAALGWTGVAWLPAAAAGATKAALLLLPALAAAQWTLRAASLARRLRSEARRGGRPARRAPQLATSRAKAATRARLRSGELLRRVLAKRVAGAAGMALATTSLVAYYARLDLNAPNGSLANLLSLALGGCLFESLLSTYDVRGRLRGAVFFLIFMVL